MTTTTPDQSSTPRDVQPAFTHLGFSEYRGKSHLYDGNCEPCCEGSQAKVIAYLESLIPVINPNPEEGLKWEGTNGTWYSGAEAWLAVEKEIAALLDGSHSSQGAAAAWALTPTVIPPRPPYGAPASVWADLNAALSISGQKRNRRRELGIGEFAKKEVK